MTFDLPLPANIANARMHWRTKHRAKKAFYAACDERQNLGLLPVPPGVPIASCAISAHVRVHNRMDRDNLYSRLKWVMDWLVTRGYLLDDNDDVITVMAVTQEIDRKNKGLTITLEDTNDE